MNIESEGRDQVFERLVTDQDVPSIVKDLSSVWYIGHTTVENT